MKRYVLCLSILGVVAAGCDRPQSSVNAGGANKPTNPAVTADATSPPKPAATELGAPRGSSKAADDGAVSAKVRSAIGADAGMKGTDISVATQDGVVQLKGTARSPEQVTLAAALAQRQEGVRRVENNVEVK